MALVTKTLNPLHFEDLEPHRFEDLTRQLIYDFRNWSSLEAIGRLGKDEGIDIRAVERLTDTSLIDESEDIGDGAIQNTFVERVWIIQCKREKSITPKKIESIVKNDLSQQDQIPYGYVLVAASDFSKRTRDVFRETVLSFGVEEFHIWGKAEIEDQLFQPKNDHLLFAYFGISLQVRRRSMKTDLRSNLAIKRKLVSELGRINVQHNKPLLIRDANNNDYPILPDDVDSIEKIAWNFWHFELFHPQGGLVFITRKCFAYFNEQEKQWDAIFYFNTALSINKLAVPDELKNKINQDQSRLWSYWKNQIPDEHRAWYVERRGFPFERILAVDEIGDAWHQPPHLINEFYPNGTPFSDTVKCSVELESHYNKNQIPIDELIKIKYFPDEIPEIETT